MKVKLIAYTPSADTVVYKAARTCYQAGTIDEIGEGTEGARAKFIAGLIKSGHTSVLEHATFTFAVEGISRVVSHELVRHRIASYSQQSQRYVNYKADTDDIIKGMYIPDDIREDVEARIEYERALRFAVNKYKDLIERGIKPQDARYVLPNAMPTQIVVTMNARALYNFFALRCCKRAQPEIQELANKMLDIVKDKAPAIFSLAGAPCLNGQCKEERRCKR